MLFSYKIKLNNGEIFEGTSEANDRFSLSRELKSHGNIPISIERKRDGFLNLIPQLNIFSGVKTGEQITFTKNLAGMLEAGLSLHRALSVLQKQTKNQSLNKIFTELGNEINSGGTFSSGLAKFPNVFSKLFVSMARAGEESGNIVGALREVESNLEKSESLTKKIKGAMMYPAVILSAMIVIGILMFAFLVPTLSKTFKELGAKLPASTELIIGVGNFLSNNLILSFGIIIGFVLMIVFLFKAKFMAKYIDFAMIHMPVVGDMVKELNTARTARTISSLLISGVTLTRSVEITEDVVQNIYYKNVLKDAIRAVERGAPFSEVFKQNTHLYPVMMSEMIEVGEETGKLSDMLLDIATFYEGEIENKTKNLSTIIEPFLMLFIGAGVGFFAISMISPLYSVMENIK